MKKTGGKFGKIFITCIVPAALGALVVLIVLESFGRGGLEECISWIKTAPWMALRNYGFYFGFCLAGCVFASLRSRIVWMAVLTLLAGIIGFTNRYMVLYRFEPVLFSDVTLIGDALHVAGGGLGFTIDWTLLIWFVAGTVAVTAGLFVAARKAGKRRCVAAAGLGVALAAGIAMTFTYANTEYKEDLVLQATQDGITASAFEQANYTLSVLRDSGTEEEITQAWAEAAEETPKESRTAENGPNIILVLCESFGGEEWLGSHVTLTRELMPFWNQLTETCPSGKIYVPKIGGGTSETEFEVLTGISSQYSYNPYSAGLPRLDSLATILGSKGYETTAIHLFQGVYYNRYRNLAMEGFQNFFTTDTTWGPYKRYGTYIADSEHYDAALERMEQTEGKDFLFLITMQNHGGYDYEDWRVTQGADEPFEGQYSDHTRLILSNYCWLLEQSDREMKEFLGKLENFDEPTVVIFFGDHLPPFGTDVYEELGIPMEGAASHMTPWLIWTNTGNTMEKEDMYAWELGAYALEKLGMNNDPFEHMVEKLRSEGSEPTGEGRKNRNYNIMCLDALFGKQIGYQKGYGLAADPAMKIGGDMTTLGYSALQRGGKIYLKPRFEDAENCRYTLFVNGVQAKDSAIGEITGPVTLQCKLLSQSGAEILNEGTEISYSSTAELVESCGSLVAEELNLSKCEWEIISRKGNWDIYISRESMNCAALTVLETNAGTWEQKTSYDELNGENQYAWNVDGRIYVAVQKSSAPGCSSEELQENLRSRNAALVLMTEA